MPASVECSPSMNSIWYTPCPTNPSANSFGPSPRRHMKGSLLTSSKPTGSKVASRNLMAFSTIGSMYWSAHFSAAGLPAHVAIMPISRTSYTVKPRRLESGGAGVATTPGDSAVAGAIEASKVTAESCGTCLVSSVTCPIVQQPLCRPGCPCHPVAMRSCYCRSTAKT